MAVSTGAKIAQRKASTQSLRRRRVVHAAFKRATVESHRLRGQTILVAPLDPSTLRRSLSTMWPTPRSESIWATRWQAESTDPSDQHGGQALACGYPARAPSPERGDLDVPITRTVAWWRLRGLGVTTICTSLSSAFK